MRSIDKIIIHYTETPEGRNVTVQDIDAWHKQKKFKCIGYHYVVYLDGSIHGGRPEEQMGAHCAGQNEHSIGVCYVGGIRDGVKCDTRTPEQKRSLYLLLKMLKKKYPNATIHGHNEFSKKECPGFNAYEEYMALSNLRKK